MAYEFTGIKRSLTITITRISGENIVSGYPKEYDGRLAFGSYLAITDYDAQKLTDAEYAARLSALYLYVESVESGFDSDADIINSPSLTDLVNCAPLLSTTTTTVPVSTTTTSFVCNIVYTIDAILPNEEFSSVFLLSADGGNENVYQYYPGDKTYEHRLLVGSSVAVKQDIAHSANKLWVNNGTIAYEYDLAISPFNAVLNTTRSVKYSAGLAAINNTTLIEVSDSEELVYEYDIESDTHTPKFNLPPESLVSGDFYLTTTGKFIVSYRIGVTYWIAQYDYDTGAQELAINMGSFSGIFGIFQHNGEMYFSNNNVIYSMSKYPPYSAVLYDTLPFNVNGASQLPQYLTSHFSLVESTTTTIPVTTTTTTTA